MNEDKKQFPEGFKPFKDNEETYDGFKELTNGKGEDE